MQMRKTTPRENFMQVYKGSFGTVSHDQASKLFPDSESCVLHTSTYHILVKFLIISVLESLDSS